MKKKLIIGICVVAVLIILVGEVLYQIGSRGVTPEEEQKVNIEQEVSTPEVPVQENKVEFDEEDLKDKIGTYLIFENFMQDFYVPEQENENTNIVDYANEAKVLIGYSLVLYSDPLSSVKPSEEQVRKAVEEYCGEHYEKYIDTAECWIAFDGDNAYDFVEAGDYTASGYCNEIESITEEDGKYTVTFVYSRPSDWDFMDGTLDQVQKYRKQFTFIYHPDAEYTKYQLAELSFLKGEEV